MVEILDRALVKSIATFDNGDLAFCVLNFLVCALTSVKTTQLLQAFMKSSSIWLLGIVHYKHSYSTNKSHKSGIISVIIPNSETHLNSLADKNITPFPSRERMVTRESRVKRSMLLTLSWLWNLTGTAFPGFENSGLRGLGNPWIRQYSFLPLKSMHAR